MIGTEELMVSFLFQLKEGLRSFAAARFGSEIQSERRIYTEETGYWCRFWVVKITRFHPYAFSYFLTRCLPEDEHLFVYITSMQ